MHFGKQTAKKTSRKKLLRRNSKNAAKKSPAKVESSEVKKLEEDVDLLIDEREAREKEIRSLKMEVIEERKAREKEIQSLKMEVDKTILEKEKIKLEKRKLENELGKEKRKRKNVDGEKDETEDFLDTTLAEKILRENGLWYEGERKGEERREKKDEDLVN